MSKSVKKTIKDAPRENEINYPSEWQGGIPFGYLLMALFNCTLLLLIN
jgi:hypothetical protein